MVILIVNDLLTTMGTGRARMKTPMRAHSPPINCTLKMVKLVMGMVVVMGGS